MNDTFRWRVQVLIGLAVHTLLACRAGAIGGVAGMDQPSQDFFRLASSKSTTANPGMRTDPRNDTQGQLITPEIDNWISSLLKEWNSPGGLSVAVVKEDDDDEWIVKTKGYGLAREDGTKVDEKTLFGIASNTKVHRPLHILPFCCIDGFFDLMCRLSPRQQQGYWSLTRASVLEYHGTPSLRLSSPILLF